MSECADQAFTELVYIVIDSGARQRKIDVISREAEARIRRPYFRRRSKGTEVRYLTVQLASPASDQSRLPADPARA